MTKQITIFTLALIFFSACSEKSEPTLEDIALSEEKLIPTFHKGYEFSNYKAFKVIGIISELDDLIVVYRIYSENKVNSILVMRTNELGEVLWNKNLIKDGDYITGNNITKLSDNTFLILAQTNSGSVIIHMDYSGQIISSKEYPTSTELPARFSSVHPLSDGSYLVSGFLNRYESQKGMIAHLDSDFIPLDYSTYDIEFSQSGIHNDSLITFTKAGYDYQMLKISRDGNIKWAQAHMTSSQYGSVKEIFVYDNHIYTVVLSCSLSCYRINKFDINGNFINGIFQNAQFGGIYIDKENNRFLIQAGNLRFDSAIVTALSTDLEPLRDFDLAELAGSNGEITGLINEGSSTINFVMDALSNDPEFKLYGFHQIRITKENWLTGCGTGHQHGHFNDQIVFKEDNPIVDSFELEANNITNKEISGEIAYRDLTLTTNSLEMTLHIVCEEPIE